jgi:hypothetical protein
MHRFTKQEKGDWAIIYARRPSTHRQEVLKHIHAVY